MGLLSNTVSICQFNVLGDLSDKVDLTWVGQRLALKGFQDITESSEEISVGWVHLDDARRCDFDELQSYGREHYLTFSLRRDQRRVPSALVKSGLEELEREFLAANPGFHKVPKAQREEMRETVRSALLSRTLPAPATWDVVWDIRSGLLTFTSFSSNVLDLFESHFRSTFEELRLVPLHPFARGERICGGEFAPALAQANRASNDAVLELIRDNAWLGSDFLRWLMFGTLNEASEYEVCEEGPAQKGERFVAYLNDRLNLIGGSSDGGVQKVTVAGPQDHFREVCTALEEGKEISDATLYLEKGEDLWRLNLKGLPFHFASFKAPGVKLEKDDLTDEASERTALFYERMFLLETGLQLFDSLFATFLRERLSDQWTAREQAIREWLKAA
jgi:hypothetical protein